MAQIVEVLRSIPGEYYLATETIEQGMKFRTHAAVYEITGELARWGRGWTADVTVIDGRRPGTKLRALLFTGKKVN